MEINQEINIDEALLISQKIDLAALEVTSNDNYLYSFQLNSSVSYKVSKWNTLFSVYYKFNGKDRQYMYKIEKGKVTPSIFTVAAICYVLEISLSDLLRGIRLA